MQSIACELALTAGACPGEHSSIALSFLDRGFVRVISPRSNVLGGLIHEYWLVA